MQNTTNLNLKKPDYTDFADIQDINDNMDMLDEAIHDTQNSVATFTSSDVADGSATSWTSVTKVDSGETHKSIFAKMSQMFKNIRFLYKLLGTTDISSIGNGTVTGGLSSLNDSLICKKEYLNVTTNSNGGYSLGLSINNATVIAITAHTNTGAYIIGIPMVVSKETWGQFYKFGATPTNYVGQCNIEVWYIKKGWHAIPT